MVSQNFEILKHNPVAADVFAEVIKVTADSGLWNAVLAWYSPSDSHWICPDGFEHGLGIHGFRTTCHSLIVKVLATRAKFLEPSVYCTLINCSFNFSHMKCFGLRPRRYGPVWTCKTLVASLDFIARSYVQLLNYIQSETMHNVSARLLQLYYLPLRGVKHSFSHVIYAPQTNTFRNIAKPLS